MKLSWALGIGAAVLLHAIVLLFGGILFPKDKKGTATYQQVDLLNDVDAEKDKPKDEPTEKNEEVQAEQEQPPDAAEIIRNMESAPVDNSPALEAASLSAIEAALSGVGGGGGDFGGSLDLSVSGGRIGGTGKGGALDDKIESAFSMAEIDQKPRAVFQAAPMYPAELRDKKLEGTVSLIFVVDENGKVLDPRVEKSTHPAFDKPALEAVRQWKFEAAVKAGQRVKCKMRVPIRFQPR